MKVIIIVLVATVFVVCGNRTCLQGWIKDGESCYKLFINKLSWEDAMNRCGKMNTKLVTLNNQDEQNFVITLLADVDVDALWIGLFRNNSSWTWTDINSTSIDKLKVTNIAQNKRCAILSNNGDWLPEQCDLQNSFLCETNVTGCHTSSGWIEHDFRCLFLLSTKQDWEGSRSECNHIGAELAVLNDLRADSFLQSQSTIRDWLWVGLTFDANYHNYSWIDGRTGYVDNVTTIAPQSNDACGAVSVDQTTRQLISMATSCSTRLFAVCEKAWIEELYTTPEAHNTTADETSTVTPTVPHPTDTFDLSPLNEAQNGNFKMLMDCLHLNIPLPRQECLNGLSLENPCKSDSEKLIETMIRQENINVDLKIKLFQYLMSIVGDQNADSPLFCNKSMFDALDSIERLLGTYVMSQQRDPFHLDLLDNGMSISTLAVKSSELTGPIYEGTVAGCLIQEVKTDHPDDDTTLSIILKTTQIQEIDFEYWSWSYKYYIISAIMTLSAYTNGSKHNVDVTFTLLHTSETDQEAFWLPKTNSTILCAFYKPKQRQWSADGCEVIKTNDYVTSCKCSHTTSFAILMKVKDYQMTESHHVALSVITSIGCSVSMIAMFISLTVFTCVRSLISERVFVHRNLCMAIMCAQIFFLAGIKATYHKIVCRVIAMVLHYSYISVFSWMLVEGLHLYTKVVQVFGTDKSRISYYFFFGWGIPLILVAISSVADFEGYGTDKSCWLSIRRNTIWAFVGPAVAVIIINVVILVMVLRILIKSVKLERPKYTDQIMAGVKGTFFLLPLLGLTWMFGLLAINKDLIVFEYAFAVSNSLQGFFVFLFHCVMNSEVRQALQRLRDRRTFVIRGEAAIVTNTQSHGNHKTADKGIPLVETRYRISGCIHVIPASSDDVINNTESESATGSSSLHTRQLITTAHN